MKRLTLIIAFIMLMLSAQSASAISFDLDSVAEWGRFPRFCVATYRWGDKFFNTYDSTYVVGTGTKFNIKAATESWQDRFRFSLPGPDRVELHSAPSTSVGLYLTYMAVSAGYDKNITRFFCGESHTRRRYRFGFDCSLLGVEFYWENNDVGTNIKRFGPLSGISYPFDGANVFTWGLDAYYFFNHKRYSQAAAFNFSKIQKRSQGSFYAGLAMYSQGYTFDFSTLPAPMRDMLPSHWTDYRYSVSTRNYGIRVGYGYNWAVKPHFTVCGSLSPIIGLRKGYINSEKETLSPSVYNRVKVSGVWNKGQWFAGITGKADMAIVTDRQTVFLGADLTLTTAIGYRFNLW